jgi:hypothetical protein
LIPRGPIDHTPDKAAQQAGKGATWLKNSDN